MGIKLHLTNEECCYCERITTVAAIFGQGYVCKDCLLACYDNYQKTEEKNDD